MRYAIASLAIVLGFAGPAWAQQPTPTPPAAGSAAEIPPPPPSAPSAGAGSAVLLATLTNALLTQADTANYVL